MRPRSDGAMSVLRERSAWNQHYSFRVCFRTPLFKSPIAAQADSDRAVGLQYREPNPAQRCTALTAKSLNEFGMCNMLQRERVAQNMAIARQNRRCPQQARLSSSGGGGLCGNSLQDLCGPVHFRRQRRSALNIALVTCAHARLRNAEFCCSLLWPCGPEKPKHEPIPASVQRAPPKRISEIRLALPSRHAGAPTTRSGTGHRGPCRCEGDGLRVLASSSLTVLVLVLVYNLFD